MFYVLLFVQLLVVLVLVYIGIAVGEDYGLASGVERRGRRARAAPGDATSRVTTKRRKKLWVKW